MWHGIESRTPFADDVNLIEYLFSVPASYKMHGSQLKSLLRDASNQVIPEAIKKRSDKQGYTTPNNAWIRKLNHSSSYAHWGIESKKLGASVRCLRD